MQKNLTSLLIGLFLLLGFSACTTEPEPTLPPITEEGKNTLGFKADGKIWVNRGQVCNWFDCEDNVVEGRLHKNADGTYAVVVAAYYTDKDKNINQRMAMHVPNFTKPGTYAIVPDKGGMMSLEVNWVKNDFYQLGSNSNASLTITKLDEANKIISGKFEGILYSYLDPTKAMVISEGRFDTKLTYSE